jgi:hypothetical protein
MDRVKRGKRPREFADEGEVGKADSVALRNPIDRGANPPGMSTSEVNKPIGAYPRSEVTGRHDAGSGANETIEGLTSSEEATRRGAEDTPIGDWGEEPEDLPVFDRADALPKV